MHSRAPWIRSGSEKPRFKKGICRSRSENVSACLPPQSIMSDLESVFGGSPGSATEFTPRLNRKRNKGEDDADQHYMESLRAAKEQKTLDSIAALLIGKPETADLVLFQLEAGKFERKLVPVVPERCLPRSVNKMRLVSKEYWEEILALVNGFFHT